MFVFGDSLTALTRPVNYFTTPNVWDDMLVCAVPDVDEQQNHEHILEPREEPQSAADPLNYDVTINTAELTLEAATELVLTALQRKLAVKLKGSGSA